MNSEWGDILMDWLSEFKGIGGDCLSTCGGRWLVKMKGGRES